MHPIHKTALAISLAATCAAGMATQAQETKATKTTKAEITGGRDVTVTGCLERRQNGDFTLTGARENSRRLAPSQYALVTDDDLSKHVGERVEIRGKAAANGSGKVSVEAMPVLGVSSMKTLSGSCY